MVTLQESYVQQAEPFNLSAAIKQVASSILDARHVEEPSEAQPIEIIDPVYQESKFHAPHPHPLTTHLIDWRRFYTNEHSRDENMAYLLTFPAHYILDLASHLPLADIDLERARYLQGCIATSLDLFTAGQPPFQLSDTEVRHLYTPCIGNALVVRYAADQTPRLEVLVSPGKDTKLSIYKLPAHVFTPKGTVTKYRTMDENGKEQIITQVSEEDRVMLSSSLQAPHKLGYLADGSIITSKGYQIPQKHFESVRDAYNRVQAGSQMTIEDLIKN